VEEVGRNTTCLSVRGWPVEKGEVLRVARTGEMVVVEAVASEGASDRVSVKRAVAGTMPVPMHAGDEVLVVGRSDRE
jgi:hypothetical protein